MRLKKKKLGEREDVERARDDDGFLLRLKTKSPVVSGEPEEDVGGKKQEQTIDAVHQKASHSEKDTRSDTADDRESQDTLRNFKILHKPIIRPPLRVFIPGHKRSTKRGSANGSLSRIKSPAISAELEGYGGKTQEQTVNTASHREKDARLHASKSESQDLRNYKILPPKPIRPPLRLFIPGHKRSPPIFTLPGPDDFFIPEEDTEDAYADQSYIVTQPHDHHTQQKPIVLRRKSTSDSESRVHLKRACSDAKHDMTNVLRAFNEMVLGTEEDFRTLFEGESLSTSLSLVSSVVEERNILPPSSSRSRSRSWSGSGMGKMGRTSMASRLARAHSCAHARTQGSRNGDGDGGEETSSDEDEFDEEKMAPGEWFDMVGLDEYLA